MNRHELLFRFGIIGLLAAVLCFIQPAPAQDVEEIVRKIDELYRANSSYARMEMEIVTPHWQRTLLMNIWTEGKEKTFIRILSPPKEKGVATLRLKTEMWNYLPRANKVIKIPPSMMMSSWMGSDFNNDDLVKEFTWQDDYTHRLIRPEDAKPELLYIESRPNEDLPIVWEKIVGAVEKERILPVWSRYYDEDNRLMRIINYSDVKRMGDRLIPSVMEVIPQDKEDQKTILRYLEAAFNVRHKGDIFSLRNLRSRN